MLMSVPLIVNCTHSLAVHCANISVREKTEQRTLCLRDAESTTDMAVTGDETETGMFTFTFFFYLFLLLS